MHSLIDKMLMGPGLTSFYAFNKKLQMIAHTRKKKSFLAFRNLLNEFLSDKSVLSFRILQILLSSRINNTLLYPCFRSFYALYFFLPLYHRHSIFFVLWIGFVTCTALWTGSSTSLPGGNQIDGLPPATQKSLIFKIETSSPVHQNYSKRAVALRVM